MVIVSLNIALNVVIVSFTCYVRGHTTLGLHISSAGSKERIAFMQRSDLGDTEERLA